MRGAGPLQVFFDIEIDGKAVGAEPLTHPVIITLCFIKCVSSVYSETSSGCISGSRREEERDPRLAGETNADYPSSHLCAYVLGIQGWGYRAHPGS